MIVEHRTYNLPHGAMSDYLQRYEQHGLPVLKRHLGQLLGFFITEIGPLNQVVHIWMYESLADRERRRANLDADPDWIHYKKINAGTFTSQDVKIMLPARFSPRWA